ncbi:hypothetical protein JVU11DRAFT_6362 [Chiua virens]|nr:hypothetical protein JVU11DRAFT_6362 [Chiua virens]
MACERSSFDLDAEILSVPAEFAQGFQTSFLSDYSFYEPGDTPHIHDTPHFRTDFAVIPDYGGIQNAIRQWPAPAIVNQFPPRESGAPSSASSLGIYSNQSVTGQNLAFIPPTLPRLELPGTEAANNQARVSPYLSPSPITPEVFDTPSSSSLRSTSESPWHDGVGRSNSQECYKLWKQIIVDAVVVTGTDEFVPQTLYKPFTEADKERYLERVLLFPPIIFMTREPSEWGISLEDALNGRNSYLVGKDDAVLQDCGPSVSIRINWPGYPSFKRQIPSRNWSKTKDPITKGKLAQNLAKTTARFIEKMSNKPMEVGADRCWKVGSQHIKLQDLVLVSLHHVSKGSWQPQFRLKRNVHAVPLQQSETIVPFIRAECYQ